MKQKQLSSEQVSAFYHDHFVADQVRHFTGLVASLPLDGEVVVDVGGGCGFFARHLAAAGGFRVRVLDFDSTSVASCISRGIDAEQGNALMPKFRGDEEIACFNLILHHLIADSENGTAAMQREALAVWRDRAKFVFVNEYVYESFAADVSGLIIYVITRSRFLSWVGGMVAKVVPSFRANTFGVGVRFRAHAEWERLFNVAGYDVVDRVVGHPERVSMALRLLLIRAIRRDSFLLKSRSGDFSQISA